MRSILTFVLRLLVDDETPQRVSGALQNVNNPQTHAFQNGQGLLELLTELSHPDSATLSPAKCDSEHTQDVLQSEGE